MTAFSCSHEVEPKEFVVDVEVGFQEKDGALFDSSEVLGSLEQLHVMPIFHLSTLSSKACENKCTHDRMHGDKIGWDFAFVRAL